MSPAEGHELVAELRLTTGSMGLDFPELRLHDDGRITWGRTSAETARRFLDLLALLDTAREAEAALMARIFRRHPQLRHGLHPHRERLSHTDGSLHPPKLQY